MRWCDAEELVPEPPDSPTRVPVEAGKSSKAGLMNASPCFGTEIVAPCANLSPRILARNASL